MAPPRTRRQAPVRGNDAHPIVEFWLPSEMPAPLRQIFDAEAELLADDSVQLLGHFTYAEDRNDDWMVSGTLAVGDDGVLVIASLTVERNSLKAIPQAPGDLLYRDRFTRCLPPGGVTGTALRNVRVPEILNAVRDEIRSSTAKAKTLKELEVMRPGFGKEFRRWKDENRRVAKLVKSAEISHSGPKGYPVELYRQVALDYLDFQRAGVKSGIYELLADRHNKRYPADPPKDSKTLKAWTNKATALGFLSQGTRGRFGRNPGPNLHKKKGTK